jgi:HK97 gp10 family phage protein
MGLNGLDEYLEDLNQAGVDVDAAVVEALNKGADYLLDIMKRLVPKDTWNLEHHLDKTTVKREGNFFFIEVGMRKEPLPDGTTARYANFQEYGNSSMAPQPYLRPTFDNYGKRAAAEMRKILKEKLK